MKYKNGCIIELSYTMLVELLGLKLDPSICVDISVDTDRELIRMKLRTNDLNLQYFQHNNKLMPLYKMSEGQVYTTVTLTNK